MPVEELAYVEEAGPGILELPAPEDRPALGTGAGPGDPDVLPPVDVPRWEQETIESFLKGTGAGIHFLAGAAERDWKFTEEDLERIAPPLTRICNRYEPILRLAPIADPMLVAHGMALYGWRSALERQRALRDAAAGERPAAGEGYVREVDDQEPAAAPPPAPAGASAAAFAGRAAAEPIDPADLEPHTPYFPDGGT